MNNISKKYKWKKGLIAYKMKRKYDFPKPPCTFYEMRKHSPEARFHQQQQPPVDKDVNGYLF